MAKGPSGALLSCVSEVPRSRTAVSDRADAVAMPKRIAINRENPAGGPAHGRFNATSLALVGWSLNPGTRSRHRPDPERRQRPSSTKFASLSPGALPHGFASRQSPFVRNRTETSGFSLRADLQSLETIVRQTSATLLDLIKCALRANYDEVTHEPLPQRWMDLINDLDRRERANTPQHREEDKRSIRPHSVH